MRKVNKKDRATSHKPFRPHFISNLAIWAVSFVQDHNSCGLLRCTAIVVHHIGDVGLCGISNGEQADDGEKREQVELQLHGEVFLFWFNPMVPHSMGL